MAVGRGVWFKKRTTESCYQLDMSYLTKKYIMDWDWKTMVSWTGAGGKYSSIGLDICPPGRIFLHYNVTDNRTGQSSERRYVIHYESTSCNYGGKRWWFLCPDCGRRCRVLYLPSNQVYFSCRVCHNLTYESQQEGKSRWWPLFTAITKVPQWQQQLWRTRSRKKRARLERKMGALNRGMQSILDWDRKKKKKRRKS
ncbi:MAG: hypothetical protein AB1746_10185 [Candidatus Zixiibacteriota bacterium]